MSERSLHFDVEEKTEIILKAIGSPEFNRPLAHNIAVATDSFTFAILDDLVQAFRKIAEGND